RASNPSDQYATPRPDSCRGEAAARAPSCSECIHSISPVVASSATAAPRVPPVVNRTPFTARGVPSSLNSGRGPRLSVLNRQATSSLLKLAALILSSGEYFLAPQWRL